MVPARISEPSSRVLSDTTTDGEMCAQEVQKGVRQHTELSRVDDHILIKNQGPIGDSEPPE